ncbi:MAG: polyprenyl synthetase family protein [Acidimicrobiia bacterium]|jgi:geranylgeranyl diphosphate synthase type I|nr:polyprenyl synthetase family protein [Acidimicrobiia bacterium]MBA3984433.1 polyprenyl synthetase family protein [Acidimicrobiia bacterium]MDQ3392448.1 polyprenyl synthetase family protein [Actinomycetota bacterium]
MATPTPPVLTAVAAAVERRLGDVLDEQRACWVALDPDLEGPFDELRRFVLAGGKRLRAAFCHEGFMAAGGRQDDALIVDACSAFELMHAFALFHDDVMDGAQMRRGAPTTHELYAALHAEHGWAGESRRFGEGMAILIGDLTFVLSDQLMAGASPLAWELWNRLRVELNVGQVLDLLGAAQRDRRADKAARISRYKSGKYTIERPLHLGAALAAPDRFDELSEALSGYGLPLGDAFQMRDDVIGAFGDPSVTGKPVGDDLREGKPTPLLAAAVVSATDAQQTVLDSVGAPGLSDADVAAIQSVIVETGALTEVERRITSLHAEAVAAIGRAPITGRARDELAELADYIVVRSL